MQNADIGTRSFLSREKKGSIPEKKSSSCGFCQDEGKHYIPQRFMLHGKMSMGLSQVGSVALLLQPFLDFLFTISGYLASQVVPLDKQMLKVGV